VPEAPVPPFRVFRADLHQMGWSHGIAIDDIHALLEPDRVIRFAELLEEDPRIEGALHERLDLVLVQAPSLDVSLLAALAARAWSTAGRPRPG
jgi:hypothetical protein